MDIATHALASLALSRAIFPTRAKTPMGLGNSREVLADLDQLSAMVSPAAYLQWYRTYAHSIVFSIIITATLTTVYRLIISADSRRLLPVRTIFVAVLLAQWLHLAMDAAQWQGTELFWPFNRTHVALDWLPTIDPWVLTILIL